MTPIRAEDLLDADKARVTAYLPPILTDAGRDFLLRLIRLQKPKHKKK